MKLQASQTSPYAPLPMRRISVWSGTGNGGVLGGDSPERKPSDEEDGVWFDRTALSESVLTRTSFGPAESESGVLRVWASPSVMGLRWGENQFISFSSRLTSRLTSA